MSSPCIFNNILYVSYFLQYHYLDIGCNETCTFAEFISLTQDNIPIDFEQECQPKSTLSNRTFQLIYFDTLIYPVIC